MNDAWIAFAQTGTPDQSTGWRMSANSEELMEFGGQTGMVKDPELALYEILDRMQGWEN